MRLWEMAAGWLVAVAGGGARRRSVRSFAETHEPGVSVPMVAQRYNLNANQIFGWRRLFREPERAAGTGRHVPVGRYDRFSRRILLGKLRPRLVGGLEPQCAAQPARPRGAAALASPAAPTVLPTSGTSTSLDVS